MFPRPTTTYSKFVIADRSFDRATGEAVLRYRFEGGPAFEEKLVFPLPEVAPSEEAFVAAERALRLYHLVAGTSYFKTYCPSVVEVSEPLSSMEVNVLTEVYEQGLGEFYYRNGLDGRGWVKIVAPESEMKGVAALGGEGCFVPLGGGKDSALTVLMLKKQKMDVETVSFGTQPRIEETAAALGTKLWTIKRQIDPSLFELNKQGVYNGHVPVSAMIATACVALAALHGKQDVILSNERSSDSGNLVVNGVEVNHQWSKSFSFEKMFSELVRRSVAPDIRFFSLLRPMSELLIVREFIHLAPAQVRTTITSCNRQFKQGSTGVGARWCGECPKCAFAYAAFAAFLNPKELSQMFGRDLFESRPLLPLYWDLCGLGANKPFECVGEVEEVIAALELALEAEHNEDSMVLSWFRREVRGMVKDMDALIERVLNVSTVHNTPDDYRWFYETL
jgi:7-cyano-7-deazaguanine synthase in queuosine biosynthesis